MDNEVLKAMRERRSIRKYKPDPVADDLIQAVVEAGLHAPSARNRQDVLFLVFKDEQARKELSQANAAVHGDKRDNFYGAPVVIAVLADKNSPTYLYDGSLAMGNLLLAGESLGLGTCWIHRAKEEFETEKYQKLLKDLKVPEGNWEGIGHCLLGWSDETPAGHPVRENRVFVI
jgi:nitroreductase